MIIIIRTRDTLSKLTSKLENLNIIYSLAKIFKIRISKIRQLITNNKL